MTLCRHTFKDYPTH